jgi:hypothetical protein
VCVRVVVDGGRIKGKSIGIIKISSIFMIFMIFMIIHHFMIILREVFILYDTLIVLMFDIIPSIFMIKLSLT